MNQEKRSLLAALLSFVVLMGWFYFFGKPGDKQHPKDKVAVESTKQVVSSSSEEKAPIKELPPTETLAATTPLEASKTVSQPPMTVVQETPLMKMEWTNRGATLSSVELKKFTGQKHEDRFVNLLPFDGEKALPLLCENCNQALPADEDYRVMAQTENTIAFEGEKNGLKVTKIYQWNPDQYLLNLKVTVENNAASEFKGRLGLGWVAKQYPVEPKSGFLSFLNRQTPNTRNLLYKAENKVIHGIKPGEIREIRGTIPWAGIEDRYFLISLVSRQLSNDQILRVESVNTELRMSFFPAEAMISSRGKQDSQYSFYLGPKNHSDLVLAGVGLEDSVDYGWFSLIAVPILKLLQFFYLGVKNWGLAVIVLTLFIKVLTNPLTVKSMKQMKSMQLLQPQLQALKEKYKDDKARLNTETMALFKANKVNPMGGCLPMVMQMPIYIALYKVLYNAIELYHAPFFGFYKDLSAPDPYFILPILLGFAMVLQQKFTPNPSADPTQRQMMMIMPIMFTGFMLFLPVGLVLYIFVNTGMSVLQQWMSQRDITWRDLFTGKFSKKAA